MKRQKFTLGARAESNGVVIYDFKEGSIGFKASVSQNGEISSSRISNNFTERTEIMKENSKLPMSVWFVLIFIVFSSIIISVKTQNTWIILAVWYFLAFVWFDSRWAINTFFRIKFQKDYDTICKAKYHAAAHKALNAYEKLKRVPTVEEVKNESMYSSNCESLTFLKKSSFLFIVNIFYIINNTLIVNPFLLIPLIPFMFLFMIQSEDNIKINKIFLKLEKILLLEPEEKELKCAIKAIEEMENYEEWKKTINES